MSEMMGSVGGTLHSFNNFGDGEQIFDNANIRSGGIRNREGGSVLSIGGTVESFNSQGRQSFVGANIQSGEVNENEEGANEKLWKELTKIGVENNYLTLVYAHLHKNPADLKAFNGLPTDHRKKFLHDLLPNYAPQGSIREMYY
ncbi:uncharacterized protein [Phaseolus vulgaris]|uniref:uncharacterized protein isoform X2 n=1 Tax=Phaseolus vulgaris TaxID=3885 RepID=UPI0035C94B41